MPLSLSIFDFHVVHRAGKNRHDVDVLFNQPASNEDDRLLNNDMSTFVLDIKDETQTTAN